MKMYQRDKILNVSSESAWQALKEMNKWLPDLSTNSGISYSMDTDFFEIGRKYNITSKEGVVMDCELYSIDEENMTVEIHAEHKPFKSILICKVLDLGAGQGRNSLYLASLGCQISAVDTNAKFLQDLVDISVKEKLNLNIFKHEINEANIKDTYDFIVATDVFMYLNPTRISSVIHNMQKQTSIGGYNLIVSALNTIGVPTIPFPFTFIENELLEYYDGWEIIKYEEYKEITKSSPYPYVVLFAKKIET